MKIFYRKCQWKIFVNYCRAGGDHVYFPIPHQKQYLPNPLLQMGLFLDGPGLPLAFSIFPGNQNEQTSLLPLEKKILEDFHLAKFIVCTDAGLAATANRKFNNRQNHAFITTQPVKKLKGYLKQWALSPTDWQLGERKEWFDLRTLDLIRESNGCVILQKPADPWKWVWTTSCG